MFVAPTFYLLPNAYWIILRCLGATLFKSDDIFAKIHVILSIIPCSSIKLNNQPTCEEFYVASPKNVGINTVPPYFKITHWRLDVWVSLIPSVFGLLFRGRVILREILNLNTSSPSLYSQTSFWVRKERRDFTGGRTMKMNNTLGSSAGDCCFDTQRGIS